MVLHFTADADYFSSKRKEIFVPGNNKIVVSIQIIDDNKEEGDEIFIAIISTSEANVVVDSTPSTVQIVDLDGKIMRALKCRTVGAVCL